nr:hypothetical protein [Alloscardovia macacae]
MHQLDIAFQRFMTSRAFTHRPFLECSIRALGDKPTHESIIKDLTHLAYRILLAILVQKLDRYGCFGASRDAKKAEADTKISFARFNSAFSFFNRVFCASKSVADMFCATASSRIACLRHLRSD